MNPLEKKFVPVMLTPFNENGSIDYKGLTHLVEFYLEAGAGGLFANCQSSEMYHLKNEERIAVVKHVVNTVNGRVPVVAAGTFEASIENQSTFIKQLYDLGTEAVILITGMLAQEQEDDQQLQERFYQLLDNTERIPLGFYECPEPYKRLLKPAQLADFVASGRVIYHKDTSLDIEQVKEKLQLTAHRPSFGLYDAYMVHAVASLQSGAAGLSCIQGNFFPELIVWLCQRYHEQDSKMEVDRVQQFFIDHMDIMHRGYPRFAKLFLQKKRGIPISTYCRTGSGQDEKLLLEQVNKLDRSYSDIYEKLDLPTLYK